MPCVSIPLEQGGVFRPITAQEEDEFLVSIPLEQGGVFRLDVTFFNPN